MSEGEHKIRPYNMQTVIHISYLIPLLPLIGAAIAGLLGAKWLKGQSHWPIWLGVGGSAVLAIWLLCGMIGVARQHTGVQTNHSVIENGSSVAAHQGESDEAPMIGQTHDWFSWISVGDSKLSGTTSYFQATAGAWFDPLTAVMLTVVCGIGFFITVFSAGYMKGEEGYFRFFAYLGLFIFMMTLLVMGNNLTMLYLGWEGVGLCSYLLIGYYYEKPAAREAAKKAFLVNRVGDFSFGIGIMLCFVVFGTVSYFGSGLHTTTGIVEKAVSANFLATLPAWKQHLIPWIPFCLMVGAFGKSAQFPLYVWLPDAMEGPTPVSALIHAATMVTAGVYMIIRLGTLFVGQPAALWTIAAVGAFTALLSASIALRQFDLKKVFAYSTISQLGFMFVGVGVLAPVAGVFHLVTHAFFKALLFLSCGVIMHAMGGVLDMRQMSGLKRVLPKTRWLMLFGCLALSGMVPFSGFFSKDEIIGGVFANSSLMGFAPRVVLGVAMLCAAFLTAYYTFRLYFRVFEGPLIIPAPPASGHGPAAHSAHATGAGDAFVGHAAAAHATASASAVMEGDVAESGVDSQLAEDPAHHGASARDQGHAHGHDDHGSHDHAHNHEPWLMILPLVVLATGALLAGYINWPTEFLGHFLGRSPSFRLSFDLANKTYQGLKPGGFGQEVASVQAEAFPWVMVLSFFIALAGIGSAYMLHLRDRARAERLAKNLGPLTRLLEAKYWVDEIYQAGIVEPMRTLGRLFFMVDRFIVDGLIAMVSWVPQLSGWILKLSIQRGSLQGYAAAMLFGVAIILLVVFMR